MSASAVQAAAQRGNAPQLSTLQNIAKYVQNAKAGCCTTFAFAAAAEMIQGMSGTPENQPKVEVVAFKKAILARTFMYWWGDKKAATLKTHRHGIKT